MRRFQSYLWLASIAILCGCASCKNQSTTTTDNVGPIDKDSCTEVPRVLWSYVTTGYDKKTTLELANSLGAAIKLDSQTLRNLGSGSATANLSLQVTKLFSENKYQEAKVSEEVYNQGIAYRSTVCFLFQLIKKGALTEKQKDAVINEMIDYGRKFNGIATKEKKSLSLE